MPTIRWSPLFEPGCGGWLTSTAVSPHHPKHVLLGGDMLGIGVSTDGGDSWQSTSGLPSWEIADFTFHPTNPRVVWVGTMSGPCLSTDGGRTWRLMRTGFPPVSDWHYSAPVQKVLIDPRDPDHLLAFGGSHRQWYSPGQPLWGAVWESRDGGRNWRRLSTVALQDPAQPNSPGGNIVAVESAGRSPGVLYVAVVGAGVFRSSDGGHTWQACNKGLPHLQVMDLAVHPRMPRTLWVALGNHQPGQGQRVVPGGVYKSTDAGESWVPCSEGLSTHSSNDPNLTARYEAIAVAPRDPERLFTADTSWDGSALYGSSDGGRSWRILARRQDVEAAYPAGLGATVIEFSPHDASTAFVAGSEYVLRTRDGGRTWTDVTAVRTPTGRWRGRGYSGLCCVNFRFNPRNRYHAVLLAMDHGNFWQSQDGLRSWTWGGAGMPNWGGGNDVAFGDSDGQVMFVTLGQSGVFEGIARTLDGGKHWTILAGSAHGLPERYSRAQPQGIHAASQQEVWAVVGGQLYYTEDGGEHWRIIHEGGELRWITAVPSKPRWFYVCGEKGILVTKDGNVFRPIEGAPTPCTWVEVDPMNPERLYATSWRSPEHGGLWRYDTERWTRLRDDRFIARVAVCPNNPDWLAVPTNDHPYHDICFATGVWISADGGRTWHQQNDGLACLRGEVIAFNPHDPRQVVFGSLGRGYFVGRWRT